MKFCIQRLIREVESRPELWDCRTRQYSERALKREAWDELCASIVPEYYASSDAERRGITATLQKKWKSVRDAFLRELKKSSSAYGSASVIKYSKQYAYYKNLMFLKPIYELRQEKYDDDHDDHHPDRQEKYDDDHDDHHPDSVVVETENNDDSDNDSRSSVNFTDHKTPASPHEPTAKKRRTEDREDRVYSILEEHLRKKRKEDKTNDPDRQFLLSLLPDLQSIDPSLRFDLKLEIMKIIKHYKTISLKHEEDK